MQEWFNWHAWKACEPQKGSGGSNPPLSALSLRSIYAKEILFIDSFVAEAVKWGAKFF